MTGRPGAAAGCAAAVVSWLGLFLHNVADLPGHTPSAPESAVPALITVALLAAWLAARGRSTPRRLVLAWGWLHLVRGALSVLPLPLLPYVPDQSPRHYAAHALYAAAQLPLVLAFSARRGPPRAGTDPRSGRPAPDATRPPRSRRTA